jgi:hypothetical protein
MESVFKTSKAKLYRSALCMLMGVVYLGCIPEPLPIENLPKLSPKVVVSSQVLPELGLVVLVTRSIGALDAGDNANPEDLLTQIAIADATVVLINNTNRDTLINLGNGFYGGITNLQESAMYELQIENNEFGKVNAFTTLLPFVGFQNISADIVYNEFDSLARIRYTFNDPPEENFYMINVQRYSATQELTSLLNPRIYTKLIVDKEFNGQPYTETFNVLFQEFLPGDSIAVSLTNISEPYYNYVKLRNDSRFGFSEFASEPINFPSNVKGGLGWFTLHTPDIRLFELQEEQ